MESQPSVFDEPARHTLRVELLTGMVLIYRIDPASKALLSQHLKQNARAGTSNNPIKYLLFETSLKRHVIIDADEIARIVFYYDYGEAANEPNAYYDNFKVLETDTNLVEEATEEGRVALHAVTQEFLPDAIIFHKGDAADDSYDSNPLLYYDVAKGTLGSLLSELKNNAAATRQFINLTDIDGEENFIPLRQISVMEFDENLLPDEDEIIEE